MQLTKADQTIIERWIDNKLGPEAIRGQRANLTTNRCEASHLTVLTGFPKCRNRLRNYDGRAKSAVHSMSVGRTESVTSANRILGATNIENCPANQTRQQLRAREKYHKDRKRSLPYRAAKYASVARCRRMKQNYNSATGYSTGIQDPVVRHDHHYNK